MRGQNFGLRIVCRVLYRCEVVYVIVTGYNDHAARMLTGSSLDAGTADGQPVDLCRAVVQSLFFQIFLT